jgi:predicted secreted protein
MTLTRPLLALCAALAAPAFAQTPAPAQNVVSLTASATLEVPKDTLSIALSTSREGSDANAVQAQLKQALEAALAEARKAARPGQLEVQTGTFSLYPRYSPKGSLNGWQGSAELLLEGRDIPAIAQLAGRLPTMTVSRVAFSLSREAREKVEADVASQAIARFRAKADFTTRQFGFAGYTLREVSVNTDMAPVGAMPMLRAAPGLAADASLPVEAGKAAVTATVSGSVQMTQ